MNNEEVRGYLESEVSNSLNDEELTSIRDQLQSLSEVFVEHALQANFE